MKNRAVVDKTAETQGKITLENNFKYDIISIILSYEVVLWQNIRCHMKNYRILLMEQ